MTTPAQIQANRLNAQKSTGPRTPEGKAAVAQNAVTHGLWAQQPVIQGEDPGQFEFYRDQMLAELSPQGPLESTLADRVVGLAWRLKRAERIQAQVFDALLAPDTSPLTKLARSLCPQNLRPQNNPAEGELALGHAIVKDFAGPQVLYRLGMVERRIEHSLYKTMAELQRLRLLRQLDPTPQPADPEADDPLRKTNPIPPHITTENPTHRRPEPANGRSSLTATGPFAMISPSAKAERRRGQVPALQAARMGSARAGQDRRQPDVGPTRGRSRELEGLRRP